MILDNQHSANNVCFIISKSDDSLKVSRYIANNPVVKAQLQVEIDRQRKIEDMTRKTNEILGIRKDELKSLMENRKRLRSELQILESRSSGPKIIPQKRGIGEIDMTGSFGSHRISSLAYMCLVSHGDCSDAAQKWSTTFKALEANKLQLNTTKAILFQVQNKLEELEVWRSGFESRKKALCMKHRSETAAKAIRNDFEMTTEMLKDKTNKPQIKDTLQIFSVSSQAFMELPKKSVLGFATIKDTGIPALQQWLIQSTLETRKANAEKVLENIITFQMAIGPWLRSNETGLHISEFQKNAIQTMFRQHKRALTLVCVLSVETTSTDYFRQNFGAIYRNAALDCAQVISTGLLKKLPMAEAAAGEQAERIVRHWADAPMHWSTYKSCNRMLGNWTTAKGVEYRWNNDL